MSNNANSFVSTQFHSDNENMQMMPFSVTVEKSNKQNALVPEQADELESLYPEIYWDVYPLIADVADKMVAGNYNPTPNAMNTIVDNIIKNGGLWYEDDDDDHYGMNAEAVPVQFGFGGLPFIRRRRRHHTRNSLRDIVRILLLRELFGRRRGGSFRRF
jgi:hypothetical protein